MKYIKPFGAGLAGALLAWALVYMVVQWQTWTQVRDFVVPIIAQQQAARQQQAQKPQAPAPTPEPSK